jgi:hypothetical protein
MSDPINHIIMKQKNYCGLYRPLSLETNDRRLDLELIILQSKFAYYEGGKFGIAPIFEDHDYDSIEQEYTQLCAQLIKSPWAKEMVGFQRGGLSELCANMVLNRYGSPLRYKGCPMLDHPKCNVKLIP